MNSGEVKLKKILSIFLSFVIAFTVFVSTPFTLKSIAANESCLIFNLNSDGKSYSVIDCSDSVSGELIIPGTYNGLPVNSINERAFYGCNFLTGITIPGSVMSIGQEAFFECSALKNVEIGSGVVDINSYAFAFCNAITEIVIPDSVEFIGEGAFGSCASLAYITLGAGVNEIGYVAFTSPVLKSIKVSANNGTYADIDGALVSKDKRNLICFPCGKTEKYTIPDGITNIKEYAFYGCIYLKEITISEGVTSIGNEAFYYCNSLSSVTISDSVTSIGSGAFSGCESLKAVYITDIASWSNIDFDSASANPLSFSGCLYLNGELITEIVIPKSVTKIKDYTFYNCTSLKSITTGSNLTDIGDYAFYYCTSLEAVTINDNIMRIGEYAFGDCTSLKYVFYKGTADRWSKISLGMNNYDLTSAKIHYNAIDHTHSVSVDLPLVEGEEGSRTDVCTACGLVYRNDKLIYANEYFAGVKNKFVSVDAENKIISLDAALCQSIDEVIVVADGFTLEATPGLETHYFGTASKIIVKDRDGNIVNSYFLSVKGDVNGDSVCDVLDCMRVQLNATGWIAMAGAYFYAGDLNGDGVLTDEDYQATVNKALL